MINYKSKTLDSTIRPGSTLREIAVEAGVSPALVTQIRKGGGRASPELRSVILNLLQKAEWRPTYARHPFLLVVDLPRVISQGKSIPVLRQLRGAHEVIAGGNFAFELEFLDEYRLEDGCGMANALRRFKGRPYSGVLLQTDSPLLADECQLFAKAGVPVVQFGYDTENPQFSSVVVDSFGGAHAAVRHLLDKGHRRIGILRWDVGMAKVNGIKKFAGYCAAMAEAGISIDPSWVKMLSSGQGEPGWVSSRTLIADWAGTADAPTALFVENSFISLPLLYPLPDDGGRLPEWLRSIETIHFEDWPLDPAEDILQGKMFGVPQETMVMAIDWEAIGRMAAKMVVELAGERARSGECRTMRIAPTLQRLSGKTRSYMQ